METQKLNEMIAEINRHFVDELLNHNYLVKDMDPYTVKILTVSGKHFTLWISNDAEHLSCYGHGRGAYFMELSFTEEEKTTIYARFKQLWNDKQQVPAEIERRRKEYEKLKAEFEPS